MVRSRYTPFRRPEDLFDATVGVLATAMLIRYVVLFAMARPEMPLQNALLGINGALSILGFLIALRRQYPILLIVFFFDYLFFSLAPLQQIPVGYDPIFFHERILNLVIVQCLAFTLLGLGALYLRARPLPPAATRSDSILLRVRDGDFQPHLLFLVTATTIVALLSFYGSVLFTTRESFDNFLAELGEKSVTIIFLSFLNPFAFIGAAIGFWAARQRRAWFWMVLFGLLAVGALLINNPFVLARFRLSALFVFVLLLYFGWNRTRILAAFLIVGLIASPVLNSFRWDRTFTDVRELDNFFVHMDYDGVTMMSHVAYYVGQNGYSYGSNIGSALLFFIPRSIWPDKSQHVAYYVFDYIKFYRGISTDNLSSPLPAEGYFAFGMPGAILFTAVIFLAFVYFERRAAVSDESSVWRLIVSISPMLTMILLRGPFLVGYSEFMGHIGAVLLSAFLLNLRMVPRRTGMAPLHRLAR